MTQRFAIVAMIAVVACDAATTAPPAAPRVEIVEAPPSGDVAAYVAGEVARGDREGVPVLVYVGASWCEPCRAFHAAAAAGQLDRALAPLRLLELDLDRDEARLAAAGYSSALVPLFARPRRDGRASGVQTEGAKKGGDYVEQLVPRVRALIDARRQHDR